MGLPVKVVVGGRHWSRSIGLDKVIKTWWGQIMAPPCSWVIRLFRFPAKMFSRQKITLGYYTDIFLGAESRELLFKVLRGKESAQIGHN